jgi:hypothetical protein
MIKFKFKFPDKTVYCLVPETWEEMTVKQAIRLNLKTWTGDPLEGIARLAGRKRAEFNNLGIHERDREKLQKAIHFLAQPPPSLLEAKHKRNITIKDRDIKIPEDLLFTSFGQAALFPGLAARDDALQMIISLYLQPIFDGKLGELEDIEAFSKVFEDMLFVDVFPIVNFFFQKLNVFRIYGTIA